MRPRNISPFSVNRTCRVVRRSSGIPSWSSSSRIWALSADCETDSSSAAFRKPPRSATAMKLLTLRSVIDIRACQSLPGMKLAENPPAA